MDNDWRLTFQEDYLMNETLYQIKFPDFWEKAYAKQNVFYHKVLDDALRHVEHFPETKEYLEGEKIQSFWHDHCEFCWAKVMTHYETEFYCTKDFKHWVCKTCFEDFKEKFNWTVKPTDEIFL